MKVVLYGATGKSGAVILKELVDRGHTVVAAARKPENVDKLPNVTAVQDDLTDLATTTSIIQGADAVVSALGPPPENTDALLAPSALLVSAIEQAGGPRLIVVGGAGSLFVAPGVTLHESGYLPAPYLPISATHVQLLESIKKSSIDWTYFSPAGFFEPGERTGKFRLGKDDLIADATGTSRISFEDYAIALVDELEKPRHHKARFTIGY
ncbi:NAD(P)-dependent oxidoreductase [Granulicella sibirica]|uniref:Rrf2-linked NADH-flavin reductase n=1 Tax=Granulicella sibirica TaxID=2479048 RepID=A0A4Q0T117_9BACT|nr:NAD(P)-dependent oxidoreductase [Granulicella sibirica]RXH56452.1 Rrf2-linked NADH-flavin reductase [Granulicella sibirica]